MAVTKREVFTGYNLETKPKNRLKNLTVL